MSRGWKTIFAVAGVTVLLGGLWVVDNFIYPLKAENPNFSDVEKAFAKLQFPNDWVEISSSENRGMFGRGCDPFNDAGCFHKSKTFRTKETESVKSEISEQFISHGCTGILEEATYEGNSNTTPKTALNLSCQIDGGVIYGASISQQRGEVSVAAETY